MGDLLISEMSLDGNEERRPSTLVDLAAYYMVQYR